MTDTTRNFLYLSDLDHTLFQSLRADDRGEHPMAVNGAGEPSSFARKDQKDLFEMMTQTGVIIPVTARSHIQMERVTGWKTGQDYDLAITDIGATLILRDNRGDGQWHAVESWHNSYTDEMSLRSDRLLRDYQMLTDTLLPEAGFSDSAEVGIIRCGKLDLPLYLTISITADKDRYSSEITQKVLDLIAIPLMKMRGMYSLHASDSEICLWPNFVSKSIAVERLKDMIKSGIVADEKLDRALTYLDLGNRSIVATGDSVSDIEFMNSAHFIMMPTHSPISNLLNSGVERAFTGY